MFGLVTCLGLLALLAVGTWRRPAVAFAGVLCLYGLKQWGQNTSSFLMEHRTLVNFAVAGLVALGLARSKLSTARHDWTISPPGMLGIALYVYAAVTLTWTPLLDVTIEQWSLQLPYILTIVMVAPLLFANAEDVKTACRWTVLVGGILCLLAMFAGKWGARGLLVVGDLYSQETNPLAIASMGGTVLIMAVVAMPTRVPKLLKTLYVLLAIAGLAVILRSGSRGQLIAAVFSSLIGWHLASRRRNFSALLLALIFGAVLAAVGFWIWDALDVDSARWSSGQSTDDVTGRLSLAMVLLRESMQHIGTIFFGIGNSGAFYYIGSYPHIAALEILAEEGLIGATLYVGILITTLQSIRHLLLLSREQPDNSMRYVLAVLTALFIFEWVLTLKQGTLLSCTYFIAYAAVLGRLRISGDSASSIPAAASETTMILRPFANLMR